MHRDRSIPGLSTNDNPGTTRGYSRWVVKIFVSVPVASNE